MIGFDRLDEIMKTEVNRKDFLKYIGIALLGLVGVTNMLQNLNKSLGHSNPTPKNSKTGYGSSPYGR